MTIERYDEDELGGFARVQKLAYRCVEEIASELEPGITEREAAARLGARLRSHGVRSYFHTPFAWFGDRTGFYGFKTPLAFFPTDRKLERGMPFILDVAPSLDGVCTDMGYANALGEHAGMRRAKRDLHGLRDLIRNDVRAGRTLREIYQRVDDVIHGLGYENAHYQYPFHVLGHKVGRLPLPMLRPMHVAAFEVRSLVYIASHALAARMKRGLTPLWNGEKDSAVCAEPGLWAIEPHVRRDGFGAKWEELLVVTESDAYWLDDDLLHVREVERESARVVA